MTDPYSSSTQPLVAIVTPVYNGQPWLERTMDCVQRQTYGNIIHIVLDNASTDDTPDVIRRYHNQRVPIKTARNEEALRQTANWNAAFKMTPANATYAMLLCGDDLIRDDAVEKLVAHAQSDKNITIVTACDISEGNKVCAPVPPGGKTVTSGIDFLRSVLDNSYNHFAWQLFFVLWKPEFGLTDFFSYTVAALDCDRMMRLMETGSIGFVMEPLFFTRHHDQNMSAQFKASYSPHSRLFRWEAAVKYARKLLSPKAARKCLREEKYFVLRWEMSWRKAKAHKSADALKARLAADGFRPTMFDYVAAALTYPAYKARQKKIRSAATAKWPRPISEEQFINMVAR